MKKHVALFSSVLMMSTTLLGAGSVFADDKMQGTTSVSTTLSIPEVPAPVPPTTDGGDNNENNQVQGHFGLAYHPREFSVIDQLDQNGQKEISISPKDAAQGGAKGSFNVGVKDTRRKNSSWKLTAKLNWTGDNASVMAGTKITAENTGVKLNKEGKLEEQGNAEVTGVKNLQINSTSTDVMTANGNKVINGVYDYQLDNVKLVIPKQENVAAGEYTGTVTWNLQETPAAK
ncbi:WxL domain-containing protein [Enterococcus faecium]|nr:WxL domain-containing protein [Enterococcus faecium]